MRVVSVIAIALVVATMFLGSVWSMQNEVWTRNGQMDQIAQHLGCRWETHFRGGWLDGFHTRSYYLNCQGQQP